MYAVRRTPGNPLLKISLVVCLLTVLVLLLIRNISVVLEQAYLAQVRASAASLQRAVLAAREQWYVRGKPGTAIPLQGFGQNNLLMSEGGWPTDALNPDEVVNTGSVGSEGKVLPSSRCRRLWQALLQPAEMTITGWSDLSWQAQERNGLCVFSFDSVNSRIQSAGIEYSPQDGRINYFIR